MTRPCLIALQFLTRLPVQLSSAPSDHDMGRSLLYYPLIGLLIGLLLIALGWLLRDTPALVATALLITTWILLTGGLHLDGLADSADAWAGGLGQRDKTLAIMKDPYCGPAGVVIIVLVLLLKFTALYTLFVTDSLMALLIAVILGRTLLPLLFLTTPYVRAQGLGTTLVNYQPRRLSIAVIILTAILIPLATDIRFLWLILAAGFTFLLLRHMMLRRIKGTTGDTAGALVEITETTVLLTAVLTRI
jgi:adenosylcobinamide-GDP ribazoletransferase